MGHFKFNTWFFLFFFIGTHLRRLRDHINWNHTYTLQETYFYCTFFATTGEHNLTCQTAMHNETTYKVTLWLNKIISSQLIFTSLFPFDSLFVHKAFPFTFIPSFLLHWSWTFFAGLKFPKSATYCKRTACAIRTKLTGRLIGMPNNSFSSINRLWQRWIETSLLEACLIKCHHSHACSNVSPP